MLNAGSMHPVPLARGRAFKSDRITVGSAAPIGAEAFVHYGVTVHDGAVIEADSFLMKGEEVGRAERWRGNPAAVWPGLAAQS